MTEILVVVIWFTLLLFAISNVIYDKLVDIERILKDILNERRYDK